MLFLGTVIIAHDGYKIGYKTTFFFQSYSSKLTKFPVIFYANCIGAEKKGHGEIPRVPCRAMIFRFFLLLGGSLAGDPAEGQGVGHGVAAHPVGAVDTAGDLTGGEQALDDLAAGVEHLGVVVDLQAAHGVVDNGSEGHGIEGALLDGVLPGAAAELVGLAGLHQVVELLNGG